MTEGISYTGDRCPHCQQPLKVATKVILNVDSYQKPAIARTRCCKELVQVIPVTHYRIQKYAGSGTDIRDDWGD